MASDIDEHQELFGKAFNAGDVEALHDMYTEDAISVWEPDKPLIGQARRDYVADFMSRNPSVDATVLRTLVTGDTAMLIVDWTIDTTDEEGKPEQLKGVAIDVLQRGEDGKWRYVIDNPYGVSNPAGLPE